MAAIKRQRGGWVLELLIDAHDPDIPFLSLRACKGQCIVGYADSEQIECHTDPDGNKGLVPMALEAITAYLDGVTVMEHYNKNDRLVKKEYFFGIEGEGPTRRIGTGTYPLVFPKRIVSSKTKTHRFLK